MEHVEPAMDREVALDRLGGDVELLDELLVLMLEQSRDFVAAVRTAIGAGDVQTVLSAAHTMKGSAANLEARALARAAERLEQMARRGDLAEAAPTCAEIEREVERLARETAA